MVASGYTKSKSGEMVKPPVVGNRGVSRIATFSRDKGPIGMITRGNEAARRDLESSRRSRQRMDSERRRQKNKTRRALARNPAIGEKSPGFRVKRRGIDPIMKPIRSKLLSSGEVRRAQIKGGIQSDRAFRGSLTLQKANRMSGGKIRFPSTLASAIHRGISPQRGVRNKRLVNTRKRRSNAGFRTSFFRNRRS